MSRIRLGIVGCGAVTARSYLPALQGMDGFSVLALVDPQIERATALASRFGIAHCSRDYREILNEVDAVIAALPHHLHAPIGVSILSSGKHLLMEKPLAMNSEGCGALIEAASQYNGVLAVGQIRRYMSSYIGMKEWLEKRVLGEVHSFDIEEGQLYNWPVASDFFFQADKSGGGVLIDTGAHILDAVLWWFGEPTSISYCDDNAGGIEADCTMELRMANGAIGRITLSRIRKLKNTALVRCDRGELEISLTNNAAKVRPLSVEQEVRGEMHNPFISDRPQTTLELFQQQLREWQKAMKGYPANIVDAHVAGRTVSLIEGCYAQRSQRLEPWQTN